MPAHICAACINWVESPDERLCAKCKEIRPATIAPLNILPVEYGLQATRLLHWPQEVFGLTNGQPLGELPQYPTGQYWQHPSMQPHVSHSRPDGSAAGMHAAAGGPIPPVAAPQMRRDAAAAGFTSGHGAPTVGLPLHATTALLDTRPGDVEQAGRPRILGPASRTRARTRSAVVAQAGPSSAARHVAVPPAQTPQGAGASSGRMRSFKVRRIDPKKRSQPTRHPKP